MFILSFFLPPLFLSSSFAFTVLSCSLLSLSLDDCQVAKRKAAGLKGAPKVAKHKAAPKKKATKISKKPAGIRKRLQANHRRHRRKMLRLSQSRRCWKGLATTAPRSPSQALHSIQLAGWQLTRVLPTNQPRKSAVPNASRQADTGIVSAEPGF